MEINFSKYLKNTVVFDNSKNLVYDKYNHQDILSLNKFREAQKEISSWEGYKETPLVNLDTLAKETNVSKIYYKDENYRFSLQSFKALGGSYAVSKLLIEKLKEQGYEATSDDLFSGKYKDITRQITVCSATDGNHGKSVAWGASIFGCQCEIYIHSHVSETREKEIAAYGAKVVRIDGNYDDSVRIAAEEAEKNGYYIVSDTSYEGYTTIPKHVMQGYTILVDEALKQMQDKPTHVFLQGGVGGFAAAVSSFLLETYEENPPVLVIVEPNNANCLLQSAKNGKETIVHGDLETIMAGLACGEVSSIAWQILEKRVKTFISIEDEPAAETMKLLSNLEQPIVAGESAVGGLAGFLIVQNDIALRQQLNLDTNSKILFFGTEGDTDPIVYKEIVGKTSQEVLGQN